MILCADCYMDVLEHGTNCLDLLIDCIELESVGFNIAIDPGHLYWRLNRDGVVRYYRDLEIALEILERNGYVISTEISERLLGINLNRKDAEICDNDIICWCARSGL